jgi:large subunit ribosomal protein L25
MTINLTVKNRNQKEKASKDMIPAVMYGSDFKATSVFVNQNELIKSIKNGGESSIVKVSGDQNENVLIHDVQRHPVSYMPIHADLYVIEKGQKVHLDIPIVFVGEAPAAKMGANIVKVLQQLSVEMDPSKAPANIEVDLSKLVDMHSTILVSDLNIPKEATLYHVHDTDVVVSVVAQNEEDLSAPVAQVDMNAVAVEEKGKKEEAEGEEK